MCALRWTIADIMMLRGVGMSDTHLTQGNLCHHHFHCIGSGSSVSVHVGCR